jgi:hypothetical protein
LCFETECYCVAQAGLELMIFQSCLFSDQIKAGLEDYKFQASLGYIGRPDSKKTNQNRVSREKGKRNKTYQRPPKLFYQFMNKFYGIYLNSEACL